MSGCSRTVSSEGTGELSTMKVFTQNPSLPGGCWRSRWGRAVLRHEERRGRGEWSCLRQQFLRKIDTLLAQYS